MAELGLLSELLSELQLKSEMELQQSQPELIATQYLSGLVAVAFVLVGVG